jgi:large subunit ribosomal protein L25
MAMMELAARLRPETGTGAAHRLRHEGYLPGIVYGAGEETRRIAFLRHTFDALMRRAAEGTVVLDLQIADSENLKVLIKEVQRNPMTSEVLHVDFVHISMDRPVRVPVAVRLVGVPEGVKNEGGFLDHVLREVEIECLPTLIPAHLDIDVTALHIGQSAHAGDIVHEGVRVVTPPDRVIAAVHGRAAEPTPAEAAAAAAAEAAEPAEGEEAEGEQAKGEKPKAEKGKGEKEKEKE